MVSKMPKQQTRAEFKHPPSEFVGDMLRGANLLVAAMLFHVLMVVLYVFKTHEELIFDRIAPKFAFDIVRTAIIALFASFWLLVSP